MTSASERRQAALSAIDAVLAGTIAAHAETEIVDFKLEAGTIDNKGNSATIGPQHEPAAAALAREAACMGNVPQGGILVVGVADNRGGPAALRGAFSDPDWLRHRIYALTQPNLVVDVEVIEPNGVRLLLINVPDALGEVRAGGRLRARLGTDCEELDGERARQFLEVRRGFDWSAQPSGFRFSDIAPEAMASARRHYQDEHGTAPGSDLEIARRLGVVLSDANDPELSNAGALLLCRFEAGRPQIQMITTAVEGAAGTTHPVEEAPLLPLFDAVVDSLLAVAFPPDLQVVGTQRLTLRALPETAIRESIVNAITHRDYRLDRAAVVVLATGRVAARLKVCSPGGLPPGVAINRLIATTSKPRNPALAQAMRVLGLAERQGVGIDTMYRLMLRDGHPPPEITEGDGDVVVRLSGGRPDLRLRAFFAALDKLDPDLEEDVRATIAINRLLRRPELPVHVLAEAAQATLGEATDTLEVLAANGVVQRQADESRAYRLTRRSRTSLGDRISYRMPTTIDDHATAVTTYLGDHDHIGTPDAAVLLNLGRVRASQVLRELVTSDVLELATKNALGPRVRYRLRTTAKRARPANS